MTITCVKCHWNPSTKRIDIASRGIGVNGRQTRKRKPLAACCCGRRVTNNSVAVSNQFWNTEPLSQFPDVLEATDEAKCITPEAAHTWLPSSWVEYASAVISPRADGNVEAGQLEDVYREVRYRCAVSLWYDVPAVDANSLSRRRQTKDLSGRRRPCVRPLVEVAVAAERTRWRSVNRVESCGTPRCHRRSLVDLSPTRLTSLRMAWKRRMSRLQLASLPSVLLLQHMQTTW